MKDFTKKSIDSMALVSRLARHDSGSGRGSAVGLASGLSAGLSSRVKHKSALAIPLEQRVMLDAAGAATFADVAVDQKSSEVAARDSALYSNLLDGRSADGASAALTSFDDLRDALGRSVDQNRGKTVVFVDSRVEQLDVLRAGVDEDTEFVVLDTNRDALQQIAEHLSGRNDVSSLHLVSHGSSGNLLAGEGNIDFANLSDQQRSYLTLIGSSLTDDADILLYGCDFGAGERGESASRTLARYTGADVAASDDATGADFRGGDWELEHKHGKIESGLAFNEDAREEFDSILVIPPPGEQDTVSVTVNENVSTTAANQKETVTIFPNGATDIPGIDASNMDELALVTIHGGSADQGTWWVGTSAQIHGVSFNVDAQQLGILRFVPADDFTSNFVVRYSLQDMSGDIHPPTRNPTPKPNDYGKIEINITPYDLDANTNSAPESGGRPSDMHAVVWNDIKDADGNGPHNNPNWTPEQNWSGTRVNDMLTKRDGIVTTPTYPGQTLPAEAREKRDFKYTEDSAPAPGEQPFDVHARDRDGNDSLGMIIYNRDEAGNRSKDIILFYRQSSADNWIRLTEADAQRLNYEPKTNAVGLFLGPDAEIFMIIKPGSKNTQDGFAYDKSFRIRAWDGSQPQNQPPGGLRGVQNHNINDLETLTPASGSVAIDADGVRREDPNNPGTIIGTFGGADNGYGFIKAHSYSTTNVKPQLTDANVERQIVYNDNTEDVLGSGPDINDNAGTDWIGSSDLATGKTIDKLRFKLTFTAVGGVRFISDGAVTVNGLPAGATWNIVAENGDSPSEAAAFDNVWYVDIDAATLGTTPQSEISIQIPSLTTPLIVATSGIGLDSEYTTKKIKLDLRPPDITAPANPNHDENQPQLAIGVTADDRITIDHTTTPTNAGTAAPTPTISVTAMRNGVDVSNRFTFDNGEIKFADPNDEFNFEANNSPHVTFTITATDQADNTATETIVMDINDIKEAPTASSIAGQDKITTPEDTAVHLFPNGTVPLFRDVDNGGVPGGPADALKSVIINTSNLTLNGVRQGELALLKPGKQITVPLNPDDYDIQTTPTLTSLTITPPATVPPAAPVTIQDLLSRLIFIPAENVNNSSRGATIDQGSPLVLKYRVVDTGLVGVTNRGAGEDTSVHEYDIEIQITGVNDAPTASNASGHTTENTTLVIKPPDFNQSYKDGDTDGGKNKDTLNNPPASNELSGIRITSLPASGTLEYWDATDSRYKPLTTANIPYRITQTEWENGGANDGLIFVPASDVNTEDPATGTHVPLTFNFQLFNSVPSDGLSNEATFSITIGEIDYKPTANATVTSETIVEDSDGGYVFPAGATAATAVGFMDTDGHDFKELLLTKPNATTQGEFYITTDRTTNTAPDLTNVTTIAERNGKLVIPAGALDRLVFVPVDNYNAPDGTLTLKYRVIDNSNPATGDTDTSDEYDLKIIVSSVPDDATASDASATMTEGDGTLTLSPDGTNSIDYGYSDIDTNTGTNHETDSNRGNATPGDNEASGIRIITIPATTEGTLEYDNAAGVTTTVAAGDSLTLAEWRTLVFVPVNAEFNTGDNTGTGNSIVTANPVTFEFIITNSAGQQTTPDNDPHTFSIHVAAVPDIPTVSNVNINVGQGQTHVFVPTGETVVNLLSYSDSDNDALERIEITSAITVNRTGGAGTVAGHFERPAGTRVTIGNGTTLTPAELSELVYVTEADFQGTVSFSFKVRDASGQESAPDNIVTINIGDVEYAPTSSNVAATLAEDNTHTFTTGTNATNGDFTHADIDGHAFAGVVIRSLPPANTGTLIWVDGTGQTHTVTVGQTITKADIDADRFTFRPAANFSGTAQFTFQVTSAEPVGDPSITSLQTYNYDFDITPVPDKPTAVDVTAMMVEDGPGGYVFPADAGTNANALGFADVDGDAFQEVEIVVPADIKGKFYIVADRAANTDPVITGLTELATGTITVAKNQLHLLVFVPDENYNAPDGTLTLKYRVVDSSNPTTGDTDTSDEYDLKIIVTPEADDPDATDVTITINEDNSNLPSQTPTARSLSPTNGTPANHTAIDYGYSDGDESPDLNHDTTNTATDNEASGIIITSIPATTEGTLQYKVNATDTDYTPITTAGLGANGLSLTKTQWESLQFLPAANYNTDGTTTTANPNGNSNPVTFGFRITNDAGQQTDEKTFSIVIDAVADAPTVNSVTLTAEQGRHVGFWDPPAQPAPPAPPAQPAPPTGDLHGDFAFADADGDTFTTFNFTSLPTVTPSATSPDQTVGGRFQYLDTTQTPAVPDGNDITITATSSFTRAQMANLVFVANTDFDGTISFSFTVTDSAGQISLPETVTIQVANRQDAPVSEDVAVTLREDNIHTFTNGEFKHTDADGDNFESIIITSLPTHGSLYLIDPNDPTSTTTITAVDQEIFADAGTPPDPDRALIANLRFRPAQDSVADSTFKFRVKSDGPTPDANGNFQPTPSQTADEVEATVTSAEYDFTFNITSVDDRPTANPVALTITEDDDTAQPIFPGGAGGDTLGFADVDGHALVSVIINVGNIPTVDLPATANQPVRTVAAGEFMLLPVAPATDNIAIPINATGRITVEAGQLDRLVFVPIENYNNPTGFALTYQAVDSGTTPNGGENTSVDTQLNITISSAADAPDANNDASGDMNEGDTNLSLSPDDIDYGYNDPDTDTDTNNETDNNRGNATPTNNAMAGVRIITIPTTTQGTLEYGPANNRTTVAAGNTLTLAQWRTLVFIPANDDFNTGDNTANLATDPVVTANPVTFQFAIFNSVVTNGVTEETDPKTFSIHVVAVDDKPTANASITATVPEGATDAQGNLVGGLIFADAADATTKIGFADVDGHTLASVIINVGNIPTVNNAPAGEFWLMGATTPITIVNGRITVEADQLDRLIFVPIENYNNPAGIALTYQVVDSDLTPTNDAAGESNSISTPYALTITIPSATDVPDANDASGGMTEGSTDLSLSPDDIDYGYSDVDTDTDTNNETDNNRGNATPTNNAIAGIRITSIPNATDAGRLEYERNGATVTIEQNDIDAGANETRLSLAEWRTLKFVPVNDDFNTGVNTANLATDPIVTANPVTFQFAIFNSVVTNGVAEETEPKTFSIHVAAVDDKPTANPVTLTVTEDTSIFVFPGGAADPSLGFADVDTNPEHTLASVIIDTSNTTVTLPATATTQERTVSAGKFILLNQGATLTSPPTAGTFLEQAPNPPDTTITIAADALDRLVFVPTENFNSETPIALKYQVVDSSGPNNGGLNTSDEYDLNITVTSEEDIPTATDLITLQPIREDEPMPGTAVSLSPDDIDYGYEDGDTSPNNRFGDANGANIRAANELASIRILTFPAKNQGRLEYNDGGGNGNLTVIDPDTIGVLGKRLNLEEWKTLKFVPAEHYNSDFPEGDVNITFRLENGVGQETATTSTINLEIIPTDDAPTFNTDEIGMRQGSDIGFWDPDFENNQDPDNDKLRNEFKYFEPDGDELATFTFVSVLTSTSPGELGQFRRPINADGDLGPPFTMQAGIEFTKEEMTHLRYYADANFVGKVSFTFQVTDSGGDRSIPYVMTIDVGNIADAPTSADVGRTIAEDSTYSFRTANPNDIGFDPNQQDFLHNDPDHGDDFEAVVVESVPNAEREGRLFLIPDTPDSTVTVGQEIPRDQIANLRFTPAKDFVGDITSFTFKVKSSGPVADADGNFPDNLPYQTAAEVARTVESETHTFEFTVEPAPDRPVADAYNIALDEDTRIQVFPNGETDVPFSDVDEGPPPDSLPETLTSVIINVDSLDPTQGRFVLLNLPIAAVPDLDDAIDITPRAGKITVELDNLNRLVFVPAPDYNNAAGLTFSYQVVDNSGAANDLNTSDENDPNAVITIVVNPIADIPTAEEMSVTIREDEHSALAPLNLAPVTDPNDPLYYYGYQDRDGDQITGIIITEIPANGGVLTYLQGPDNTPAEVTAGTRLSLDEWASLVFVPNEHHNTEGPDSAVTFKFSLTNDAGEQSEAKEFDIVITAEPDAPEVTDEHITWPADRGALTISAATIRGWIKEHDGEGWRVEISWTNPSGDVDSVIFGAPQGGTPEVITDANRSFTRKDAASTIGTGFATVRTLISTESLTIVPKVNTAATLNFSVTVTDESNTSATAELIVDIVPDSNPPTSADSGTETPSNRNIALTEDLFEYADVDAGDEKVAVVIVTEPARGQIFFDGQQIIVPQTVPFADLDKLEYRPEAGGNPPDYTPGTTSFTFYVENNKKAQSDIYTVTVNITEPINQAPEIIGDLGRQLDDNQPALSPVAGNPLDYNLDGNVNKFFRDPDGDALSVTGVSDLPPGLSYDPLTGRITGLPTVDDAGFYRFKVTVEDKYGASATHELSITIGDIVVKLPGGIDSFLTVTPDELNKYDIENLLGDHAIGDKIRFEGYLGAPDLHDNALFELRSKRNLTDEINAILQREGSADITNLIVQIAREETRFIFKARMYDANGAPTGPSVSIIILTETLARPGTISPGVENDHLVATRHAKPTATGGNSEGATRSTYDYVNKNITTPNQQPYATGYRNPDQEPFRQTASESRSGYEPGKAAYDSIAGGSHDSQSRERTAPVFGSVPRASRGSVLDLAPLQTNTGGILPRIPGEISPANRNLYFAGIEKIDRLVTEYLPVDRDLSISGINPRMLDAGRAIRPNPVSALPQEQGLTLIRRFGIDSRPVEKATLSSLVSLAGDPDSQASPSTIKSGRNLANVLQSGSLPLVSTINQYIPSEEFSRFTPTAPRATAARTGINPLLERQGQTAPLNEIPAEENLQLSEIPQTPQQQVSPVETPEEVAVTETQLAEPVTPSERDEFLRQLTELLRLQRDQANLDETNGQIGIDDQLTDLLRLQNEQPEAGEGPASLENLESNEINPPIIDPGESVQGSRLNKAETLADKISQLLIP